MDLLFNTIVALIATLHVYILILEMFFWDKPRGMKVFRMKQDFATSTKVLAANQGLYNGFLAAGLLWGLYLGDHGDHIKTFFLICILIAGIFGAATANKRILYIQAIPAAFALLLFFFK